MTRRLSFIVVLGLAAAGLAVNASVPLGVYAIVDKVVLEPSDAQPERVQVWGTFALWEDGEGMIFRTPGKGYLYYSCAKQQARICRDEWSDLKSIAGTGQIIGFGSRSLNAGRLRGHAEKASAPDSYPIQFGIVQLGSSPRGAIFDQLKAVARAR